LGQKTHPIGFRLGTTTPWQARWFAARGKAYSALAIEDQNIRKMIKARYEDSGGISRTEIERGPQELVISIHTARPGIVIGRGGTRVDELRNDLEKLTGKRARLNIQEIRQPELDAYLVARNVAEQLERRVAFRRAMRQSVTRTMQAGAEGVKMICAGRLGGAEIARSEKAMDGRVPLHTLRANVDFAIAEAATTFGRIGAKVWIYSGDLSTGAAIVGTAMRQAESPEEEARPPRRRRTRTTGRATSSGGGRGRAASAKPASDPDEVPTQDAPPSDADEVKPEETAAVETASEETAAPVAEADAPDAPEPAEADSGDDDADVSEAEKPAPDEAAEEKE
jgi:small subunit ribosomal protein S3